MSQDLQGFLVQKGLPVSQDLQGFPDLVGLPDLQDFPADPELQVPQETPYLRESPDPEGFLFHSTRHSKDIPLPHRKKRQGI